MSATGRWRIGVDIGGTFTDFVLADAATGRVHNEKLLTTPHDPSRAVLEGIRRLLDAHRVAPADVALVIHGTTLVANALIERKGVRTALVTTRGFRDVLEIGLEWRYDTYDLQLELPPPLALARVLEPVILKRYRAVPAVAVARAMLHFCLEGAPGVAVVPSDRLLAFRDA